MSNAQRLTKQQKERLQAKLAALAAAGQLGLGDTKTEWASEDYVIGSRDDYLQTGVKRPCCHCGEPVFTSRQYPKGVPMICEECAAEVFLKEGA
jgi:hypothetical protein